MVAQIAWIGMDEALGMNQQSIDVAQDLVDAVTQDLCAAAQVRTSAVEQRLVRARATLRRRRNGDG